jgi:hypothetical protein
MSTPESWPSNTPRPQPKKPKPKPPRPPGTPPPGRASEGKADTVPSKDQAATNRPTLDQLHEVFGDAFDDDANPNPFVLAEWWLLQFRSKGPRYRVSRIEGVVSAWLLAEVLDLGAKRAASVTTARIEAAALIDKARATLQRAYESKG